MKESVLSFGLIALIAVAAAIQGCGGGGADAEPYQANHKGIVVRLTSTQEGRKPYLRVDVTLMYPASVANDATMVKRIEGAEGLDAVRRAIANLPAVEEIEQDQNGSATEAAQAVKQSMQRAGLAVPEKVLFPQFVIQG